MEKLDVVIVGAGLSGLSAAFVLAEAGLQVLVLEKGSHPGSKNVTGGRIYLNPVRPLLPGLWQEAPFERPVTKEILTIIGERSSASLHFTSARLRKEPFSSYTVLRSLLDKWLSEKVMEKGGFVIPQKRVDELLIKDGRVIGIRAGEEEIEAEVTILADGVLSLLAEGARIKERSAPRTLGTGIKEVIELAPEAIQDRFGIAEDEGVAQLFFGALTDGMLGGGFLYTNYSSLSLGVVLGVRSMIDRKDPSEVHRILDAFKERAEIFPLIRGGKVTEYSAHMIPEGGLKALFKPYGKGYIIVGDAAGLTLNLGITVRGMDMAIASGVLAARTAINAKKRADYSEKSLSEYQSLLDGSFVMKDMKTFSRAQEVLENPHLYGTYPEAILGALESLFWIGNGPKEKLSRTACKEIKSRLPVLQLIRDLLRFRHL